LPLPLSSPASLPLPLAAPLVLFLGAMTVVMWSQGLYIEKWKLNVCSVGCGAGGLRQDVTWGSGLVSYRFSLLFVSLLSNVDADGLCI
jgi:hypothetical protein